MYVTLLFTVFNHKGDNVFYPFASHLSDSKDSISYSTAAATLGSCSGLRSLSLHNNILVIFAEITGINLNYMQNTRKNTI